MTAIAAGKLAYQQHHGWSLSTHQLRCMGGFYLCLSYVQERTAQQQSSMALLSQLWPRLRPKHATLLCVQGTLEYSTEAPAAKTLAVLRDPSNAKRGAQYLSWHPDGSRKVCHVLTNISCTSYTIVSATVWFASVWLLSVLCSHMHCAIPLTL